MLQYQHIHRVSAFGHHLLYGGAHMSHVAAIMVRMQDGGRRGSVWLPTETNCSLHHAMVGTDAKCSDMLLGIYQVLRYSQHGSTESWQS
jgi:hypothetical protein